MNKKAQWGLAPTIGDWISWLVIVVLMIVATVIFSHHAAQVKNAIQETSLNQENGYFMLNLMRTPLEIDTKKGVMSDLVALWVMNDKYQDQLTTQISTILDLYYNRKVNWVIEAKSASRDKSISNLDLTSTIKAKLKRIGTRESSIDIPLTINPDDLFASITLTVYYGSVQENSWCFDPLTEACTETGAGHDMLCKCERVGFKFIWTDCVPCTGTCNPVESVCS